MARRNNSVIDRMVIETGASREQCARFLAAAVRAVVTLALAEGAKVPKLGTMVAGMRTRRYVDPRTREVGVSYKPFVRLLPDPYFLRRVRDADVQR